MTVLFSSKAEIALKTMLYLATSEKDVCIDVKTISAELKVPKMFAAKILQELTYHNLVKSKKGKMGGFCLGGNKKEITVKNIIEAIDGLGIFNQCLFGFPKCGDEQPCPAHHKWATIRKDIYDMISTLKIYEIKEDTLNKLKFL